MSEGAERAEREIFVGRAGREVILDWLLALLRRLSDRVGVVLVVSIGLDRLSQINDTWGYETGDALLSEVNRRLRNAVGRGDLVAPVGGDQFVVICESEEGEDVEAELAARLTETIAGPYSIDDHTVYVTASAGVSGTQDASDDPEELLSAAETARAEARRGGGRRWERADQVLRVRVREQVRTGQALHSAIENGELKVHYQPVIDLASGEPVAFEALARWKSPQLGNIPPSHFIARAEEIGLIVPIGHWMLDEVAREWANWNGGESSLSAPGLAVNVSGMQLRLDLDALVAHLLRTSDALVGELWVEITESVLLNDPEGTRDTLQQLKALGIRLAIDDFGTGYSSLSQLRQLPVDAIKIDRVFVGRINESPRDRAIVKAIIELAHALGIFAIAEGVETEPQLAALDEMSCDQIQGFLFSPAVPFEDVDKRLRREPLPRSGQSARHEQSGVQAHRPDPTDFLPRSLES